MAPQRYQPIPQNDDNIILSPIYNYNSGIPDSVPSASAPSIPSSPPPSFHSSQSINEPPSSPGTPRPVLRGGDTSIPGPWNGSDGGADTDVAVSSANDASLALALLRSRVDRLEESLGRLLLEKESQANTVPLGDSNCCVTFTGPLSQQTPETQYKLRGSNNCCVTFRDSSNAGESFNGKHRRALKLVLVLIFGSFVAMLVGVVSMISVWNGRPRMVGCGGEICGGT